MNLNAQKSLPPGIGESNVRNEISWPHRFAALVAILSFLSIVLSSRGLSSSALIRFALIASDAAALAAVFLALWLWLSPSARYIKIAAVLEALLGAGAALAPEGFGRAAAPAGITAEAAVASAFFGLSVACALFTRTDWRWDEIKTPDVAAPSLRLLSVLTAAMIYVEFVLGAAYRAGAARFAPHLILGVASSIAALWMLELALNKFPSLRVLKIAAVMTGELVVLQIFLGLVAYSMELNSRALARPLPGLPVIGATHAAAAALTFAASLFVTFEAFKYLSPASRGPAPSIK